MSKMVLGHDVISIGIPAHNEEESIQRSVKRVLKQSIWKKTPGEKKEIIVCANACTDKTVEKVREMQVRHPEIKLIELKEKGKGIAWNAIVRQADKRAGILFFSDADVLLHSKALERIQHRFKQQPELELVGGKAVPVGLSEARDPKVRAYNVAMKRQAEQSGNLSGTIYGIRKSCAEKISMPKGILVDDLFLQLSVPRKKFARENRAIAYYRVPQTAKDIALQQRRYAMGIKQLERMGFAVKSRGLMAKAKTLKGLPLKQKIARINFYLKSKINFFSLRKGSEWQKIISSKIQRKKR